jgi:hypothetical protein
MILLVELTFGFYKRYVLLDPITDRYTDNAINVDELFIPYRRRYRNDRWYSALDLPFECKEVRYDISDIDLTKGTATLSAIYNKYPELLL